MCSADGHRVSRFCHLRSFIKKGECALCADHARLKVGKLSADNLERIVDLRDVGKQQDQIADRQCTTLNMKYANIQRKRGSSSNREGDRKVEASLQHGYSNEFPHASG